MRDHCNTGNNIKDSDHCKKLCNDGNGNDVDGCVDGYKSFCAKPENRTTEFCMNVCAAAADTRKDLNTRNSELRAMCNTSMISYCNTDINQSFGKGTDKSKFCKSYCNDNTRDTDSKASCDTMITNYCVSSGSDADFCRCINPPEDLKPYLTAPGVNGIHCIDGTCKSLGYKTRSMENSKCPECIQTATAMNNENTKLNINQTMVCNVSGVPVATNKPSTPSTPGTPTSGGSGDNGTVTTSSGEENEEITSSGYTKSSGKSTSSGGTESEKGFFDSVDKTTFIIAMVL